MKPLLVTALLLFTTQSRADFKFDTFLGYYTLDAQTKTAAAKFSALGVYAIQIRKTLVPQVDFGLGYTIQTSQSFVGDVSYGPDLGLYYFPVSNSNPLIAQNSTTQFKLNETFKPYIGMNFHQRNYQSAKSSYAGFSLITGCEFDIDQNYSINTQLRLLNLSGPEDSTAKEINLLGGLTFWF